MACDLRVGSERCRLGMPPARLGIVYPPGGLQRFLRAIGPAQTRKVFLTARYFDGGRGLEHGHAPLPGGRGSAGRYYHEAGRGRRRAGSLSIAGLKRSLYHLTRPLPPSVEADSEMEDLAKRALESRDAVEALEAFAQKRDPGFKGE